MSNIETIVIVGAGQAGASAILELRGNKYVGKIILIGDEAHLPYERPPLSKDVILKPEDTKIEILSEQKLAELGVETIRGNGAVKINPDVKTVELQNGDLVAYDKLLCLPQAVQRAVCQTLMPWASTCIHCATLKILKL